MTKRFFSALAVIALIFTACEQEEKQDPFAWFEGRVGHLTPETQVHELDSLFANDSIHNPVQGDSFATGPSKIEIYEKGGKQLLTLTPTEANDTTATISIVRVHDPRYKTQKGISINSTFKEISDAYKVGTIDRMGNQVMIRLQDQDFYFTISAKDLPDGIEYNQSAGIDKTQIPDGTKPKYMFVGW